MQRNVKKIIDNVKMDKKYSMRYEDLPYFMEQLPEGTDINLAHSLLNECFKFGYAQGQKAGLKG